MTRIDVNGGGWCMTEESIESIISKCDATLYIAGRFINFIATNDDLVYLRPEAIIAITKVGFVPAKESNND